MVTIVQSVTASDCGSECRRFESTSHPKRKGFPVGKSFFNCYIVLPDTKNRQMLLAKTSVCYESEKSDEDCLKNILDT